MLNPKEFAGLASPEHVGDRNSLVPLSTPLKKNDEDYRLYTREIGKIVTVSRINHGAVG